MNIANFWKYKKYILFILLILGTIVLINNYLFTSTFTLKIEIGKTVSDQKITLKVTDISGKVVASKDLTGAKIAKFRLSIGSFNVSASQDDSETIGQAKTVRFKSSELKMDLEPQLAVNKIGSESLGCDVVVNSVLYSYSCTKSSLVLQHKNPPDKFVDPVPLLNGGKIMPPAYSYQDGVIVKFGESEAGYLNFVNLDKNEASFISTPTDLDVRQSVQIVDEANTITNKRFLIIDKGGVIYSYQNINDSNPKKLQLPDNKKLPVPVSNLAKDYSLYNDRLAVYVGKTETPGDNRELIEAQSKIKNGFLYIADLSQATTDFKTVELPPSIDNNDIQLIDASHLAVLRDEGLDIYTINDKFVELKAHFTDVSYVSPGADGSAWFLKDDGIYKYQNASNQAVKIFHSSHLKPSRVVNLEGQTIFNAFVENDELGILHSYLINNRATAKPRLEDKLPYTSKNGLPVLRMDYSGNQIKVQLALTSLGSDKQTGQVSYDQAEFDSAKKKVLERLQRDGFDINKLQFFFTN